MSLEPIKSWVDVATALGVIVAAGAATVAVWQIRVTKANQLEQIKATDLIQAQATARQLYDYLKLALEHPELSSGVMPTDEIAKAKYEWFVAYMLNAGEQMMLSDPDSKEWMEAVSMQVEYHADYYSSPEWNKYDFDKAYSPAMRKLIAVAREKNGKA